MQSIHKKRCDPADFQSARERAPRQTIETIINSRNHYLAAVRTHSRPVPLLRKGQMRKHRGNQPKLYQAIKAQFIEHDSFGDICKGTRNRVSPVVRCYASSPPGRSAAERLRRRSAAFAAVKSRKTPNQHGLS